MTQTRVLLADDHKIVVEGLRSLLRSEFDLIGTCENGAELVEAAERLRPVPFENFANRIWTPRLSF
jgi:DNA-binding NarL/FixJ family response regulator